MKKQILTLGIVPILALILASFALPNNKVTTTFKVMGVCDMCKERIEAAVDVKGVSFAEYQTDSQKLTVTYKPEVISIDKIHDLIATVGHDTELKKAPDSVYQSLPGCCKYRDGAKCDH